jgi:dTDP-4-dehydrorhamnose reductase
MILVLGKSGQVASELNKLDDIMSVDRSRADLTDPTACKNIIADYMPEAVINAAAYTAVDKAEKEETLATLINGEAPGAMANACAELNIPLVHISTDYVFNGTGIAKWQVSDDPNPVNAYGKSKFLGEEAIKASGCIYAILRTSWVVSAHGDNFVKTMLRLSETKDTITVVDDQIGGPTCAGDIAKTCVAIARQLLHDKKKSGIYHYSGTPDVSWYQFANAIFEESRRKILVNPIATSEYPTAALRPLNSRLDCRLTEKVFGLPRPYWRDGIKGIIMDLESNNEKA